MSQAAFILRHRSLVAINLAGKPLNSGNSILGGCLWNLKDALSFEWALSVFTDFGKMPIFAHLTWRLKILYASGCAKFPTTTT
ncbi:MAG TPA: hypothetical protein DDZ51_29735 [Planctomycetaceae bacterium]|nr:hypothetical protein [Planctomycetaceae bacterium]